MRRPRNIKDYGNKVTAREFLEELLRQVDNEPDRVLIRIKVDYSRWDPKWEKKT